MLDLFLKEANITTLEEKKTDRIIKKPTVSI